MYEDLIKALRLAADKQRFGNYPTITVNVGTAYELATALESLTAQLSALQSENAELREENGCLQHNVAAMETRLDQQAKNCETLLAEKDSEIASREQASIGEHAETHCWRDKARTAEAALSRVEAERDAYRALGTIEDLSALVKARDEGRVVDEKTALAMAAGARAIENNKRLCGTTYCYDVFGEFGGPKEISYSEAARILREAGASALREEGQDNEHSNRQMV